MGAYTARHSMNSCQCNGPNPSGQRREALASAQVGGREKWGYYEQLRYSLPAYAPSPRPASHYQSGGLREEDKKRKRDAASEKRKSIRNSTPPAPESRGSGTAGPISDQKWNRTLEETGTNIGGRRYSRVAGDSGCAAPRQRCASCYGHTGSRSRGCRHPWSPKGVPRACG